MIGIEEIKEAIVKVEGSQSPEEFGITNGVYDYDESIVLRNFVQGETTAEALMPYQVFLWGILVGITLQRKASDTAEAPPLAPPD